MKCDKCGKELTKNDFSLEERYLSVPRGFLGEGWGAWLWKYNNTPQQVEHHYRCKKHREGMALPKVFADINASKKWIRWMKQNKE